VNDEPIFSGQVDDWNIDFDVSGDSTTTAVCADGFSLLGQVLMGTATRSAESSGTRIGAVLTEAAWPTSKRDIDTGQVTLQADTPAENTNVLDYIQTVTQTEFGAFYMDRVGLATFEDRLATQNFGSAVVLGGTGVPIVGVQIDYGTEQLYNQVTVSRENGGTAVRSDSTSQTAYGINELSQSGLLFDDDTELGELGDYLLSRYKDPTFRIQQVDIRMGGLGTADQSLVAGLEIADPVQVTFTPSVGSAVTQYATIDRIEHSVLPSEHVVTLSMSQAQPSFILSDAVFGELDDDRLGF
jgi:hypothetical protein